jgi:hypothetical protein
MQKIASPNLSSEEEKKEEKSDLRRFPDLGIATYLNVNKVSEINSFLSRYV